MLSFAYLASPISNPPTQVFRQVGFDKNFFKANMRAIESSIVAIATLIALSRIVESDYKPFRVEECLDHKTKALAFLNTVYISDCPGGMKDGKCILKTGSSRSITIEFTPKTELKSVKVAIHGKKFMLAIPFNLKPDEACGNYGLNCPLEPNVPVKFTLSLPILQEYPKIYVKVQIKLSSRGKQVSCIQFDAEIQ